MFGHVIHQSLIDLTRTSGPAQNNKRLNHLKRALHRSQTTDYLVVDRVRIRKTTRLVRVRHNHSIFGPHKTEMATFSIQLAPHISTSTWQGIRLPTEVEISIFILIII